MNESIVIYLAISALIGASIIYLFLKATSVSRNRFDSLHNDFISTGVQLHSAENRIVQIEQKSKEEQANFENLSILLNQIKEEKATITASYDSLYSNFENLKSNTTAQAILIENLRDEKQDLFAKNAELTAINASLEKSLIQQKIDLEKIRTQASSEFQNIANKILEEKSEKFTTLNQNNLKTILEPFAEKLGELRQKVNETYDKESKERFSLSERVKELALLNQQISDDAKKLTRALKGDNKTQGNWGEMILESILEKSGLAKGREYFLEYQLHDENNNALYSEYSGKKMRPDAVVKYPDERNIIIDSKVSLTAFTELVDETDPENYQIKLNHHLNSIKNHIKQLSDKAYDDYDKSLDFVMLFIPSESAYIAAMQADPHLWNFAYEKRILLLNPSNLITSLKLVSDLWKREYQNKNAMEIADRGAKLYDKFVGFIENLEKLGKNIDQAQSSYHEAFKQLSTGKDNLISQTQKLKNLGIKNKKKLSYGSIEQHENESQSNNQHPLASQK